MLISMSDSYTTHDLKTNTSITKSNLSKQTPEAFNNVVETYEERTSDESLGDTYEKDLQLAKDLVGVYNDTLEHTKKSKEELEKTFNDALKRKNNSAIKDFAGDPLRCYTPDEYETLMEKTVLKSYDELDSDEFNFDEEDIAQMRKSTEKSIGEYRKKFNEYLKSTIGMTYEEYQEKMSGYESDISILKASKYKAEQEAKELPYLIMAESDEFLAYVEEQKKNPTKIDFSSLDQTYGADGGANQYRGVVNEVAVAEAVKRGEAEAYMCADFLSNIRYDVLTDQDKMMYSYLYDTKGVGAAKKYLADIEDRLNAIEGKREADSFIASISDANGNISTTALNSALTAGKGFEDGIESFAEGIGNIFATEGIKSTNQYAQIYILAALEDHKVLKTSYDVGLTTGQLAPTLTASALVSVLGTPAAGKAAATGLLFASNLGSEKNKALIEGNGMLESCVYGTCSALTTSGLTYLVGKIPGLSAESGLSFKNIMLDGFNKANLTYAKQGLRYAILDEEVNLDKLNEDAKQAFFTGALSSFILNGTGEVLNFTANNEHVSVDLQNVANYLNDHKGAKVPTLLEDSGAPELVEGALDAALDNLDLG